MTKKELLESLKAPCDGISNDAYRCWCSKMFLNGEIMFPLSRAELLLHWAMADGWKKHLADYAFGGTHERRS